MDGQIHDRQALERLPITGAEKHGAQIRHRGEYDAGRRDVGGGYTAYPAELYEHVTLGAYAFGQRHCA